MAQWRAVLRNDSDAFVTLADPLHQMADDPTEPNNGSSCSALALTLLWAA
jgi:hypothetical protein